MHHPVFQRYASLCSSIPAQLVSVGIASLTLTTLLTVVHVPASGQAQTESPTPAPENVPDQPNARPTLRLGSQGESVSELQALLKLLGYYSGSVDGIYRANTAAAVSAFQQAIGLQADGVVGPATWNRLLPAAPTSTATAPTPAPTTSPTPTASPAPTPAPTASPAPAPTATTSETTSGSTSQSSQADNADESANETASIDFPVLRTGTRGPAVARLQERLQTLGFYDGAIDGVFGAETQAAVQEAQRSFDLEPDGVVGPETWSALLR